MKLSPYVAKLANLAKRGLANEQEIDDLITEVRRCTQAEIFRAIHEKLSDYDTALHAELSPYRHDQKQDAA